MACYYLSQGKKHRLTVRDFDAPMTTTSGSQQLRNYSSGYVSSVQQDTLTMSIQLPNKKSRLELIQTLRNSQKTILSTGNANDVILWPERSIAYRVFPKNIPVNEKFNESSQTMRLQFGIVIGLIETGLAGMTGIDGAEFFEGSGWVTHLPDGVDEKLGNIFSPPFKGNTIV